ncbi:iron hydrogenase [Phlegmacium glaucopus]|nr:iron hydrogenase [Phlegmacium glaucopus]
MVFSGALTLTDLNDFISPSQACIKPVEQTNAEPEEKGLGAASTEIRIDSTGAYFEVAAHNQTHPSHVPSKKLTQAQISLNDCLACSGCITSAESVLITLQSHTEVLNFLESNGDSSSPNYQIPVISIAPQSLASLAASLSASLPSTSETVVTSLQVLRRIQVFCRDVLGFAYVFDTTFARHLALQEHVEEFLERKEKDASGIEAQLPMLASACPGWICYAEKAHAEMLPFIARTKSPQQVMGTLVKEWMATHWGKKPQEIYHVSVMPCYDKKLEASRQDFYNDLYSTRDVDCVITTGELELMMREKAWDFSIPVVGELEGIFRQSGEKSMNLPELLPHPGTSSGSYLHSIMHQLQSKSAVPLIHSVKTIRNTDYEEHILIDGAGKMVFKGAKCYGFRNLQNVVRKVGKERGVRTGVGAAGRLAGRSGVMRRGGVDERGKEKNYDYVEVMACPGGCVNGGGQLKPGATRSLSVRDEENYERRWEDSGASIDGIQNGRWGDKNWTRKVEDVYWKGLPDSNDILATLHGDDDDLKEKYWVGVADHVVQRVMVDLCGCDGGKWIERRRELFRTQYRAVESEVVGLAVKW